MRIIPAIDIIDGKCVRLTKGDYTTKKIYNENPLEVAKEFEDAGIEYLHVVDLDGAKANQIINYKVLEKIALKTNLNIDFGGGLKSDKDLEIAFNSGASQITGGSIAVKNTTIFESWIEKFGSEKIILGADFYPDTEGGKIATNGWQEESSLALIPFSLLPWLMGWTGIWSFVIASVLGVWFFYYSYKLYLSCSEKDAKIPPGTV